MDERIRLVHGNGGRFSRELTERILMPHFQNDILAPLHDAAQIPIEAGRLAMTTDSYVVKPPVFPGGNIGKLAICGTVNDLVMAGAVPRYLTCGLILEEGLELGLLETIVATMGQVAKEVGVYIVTGDTKVVEAGAVDGLYINTAGIGQIPTHVDVGPHRMRAGLDIILTGSLGDHAVAVMGTRFGMTLPTTLVSDCAPLFSLLGPVLEVFGRDIALLRDPTRGGLATALCEIAAQTQVGIVIEESQIPIHADVDSVCQMLGYDPLYLANEGKTILFVNPQVTDSVLGMLRAHPLGREATCIGRTMQANPGKVGLQTILGGVRLLEPLGEDQVPRIC